MTTRDRYSAIERIRSTRNPLHQNRLSVLVFGLNDVQRSPLRGVGARLIPKSAQSCIFGCGGYWENVGGHLIWSL